MSDIYERLNDEAERRTGELSSREYAERYKPGRDCDPAPVDEVSEEEDMEWRMQLARGEEKQRQEELCGSRCLTLNCKGWPPYASGYCRECESQRIAANEHEPIRSDYQQRERLFQRFRETLMQHGIPFHQADFLAEKLLVAFTEADEPEL